MTRQAISPHVRGSGRKSRTLNPSVVRSRLYPMPASVFQATTYADDPLVSQNEIEVDSAQPLPSIIRLRSSGVPEAWEDSPCS